ncbi:MAG: HD domain-containing protein, partial [Candidatus Gracilibacteria bacterium]|nr:HD domain-containing protein [Candidatus Gracilibacteria bacterium]
MYGFEHWTEAISWGGLLLGLATLLTLVAVVVLASGKKKVPLVQEICLRDLSVLWTKDGAKTIHISELSPLWRDERLAAVKEEALDLHHPRAMAFMENIKQWGWFDKFPAQKAVCGQILHILDREGHCPSVVNLRGDVEGSWDENTYRILSRTTLLDHSINVAEQVVRLLSESKAWHVIPDTMVAALAHDLGKLESMRGFLYSIGEHPLAAGRPLAGLADFNDLPKKNEILRAIKLHHKMPEGLLGKTLKKADQLARQQELEEAVSLNSAAISEVDPVSVQQPEPSVKREEPSPPAATNDAATAAWQAQADIYGESDAADQKKDIAEAPKLMDISTWFDAARFLAELKPYINKMFGRRFLAFSMPEGIVYFQVKA